MRERLDEHSRYLESQLAGLEAIVQEKGESNVIVPPLPDRQENKAPHPVSSLAAAPGSVSPRVSPQPSGPAAPPPAVDKKQLYQGF